MKQVVIIGGGASGILCAIVVARGVHGNGRACRIILCEKNPRLGKKILATGNGRCNFTNNKAADLCNTVYSGVGQGSVAEHVLRRFTPRDTIAFFESIGIQATQSDDGRVYPASMQAAAVLGLMEAQLEKLGVEVLTDADVQTIQKENEEFEIELADGRCLSASAVVLAMGGNAAPKSGSDGRGLKLLRAMGHTIVTTYPALVGLKAPILTDKGLKGVRSDGVRAMLYVDGRAVAEDKGEVQFNDYGMSGIPIMNLTVYGGADLSHGVICLDFVPDLLQEDLLTLLYKRKEELAHLSTAQFLWGFVHEQLARVLTQAAGINGMDKVAGISHKEITALAGLLKGWSIPVAGTAGYQQAQATGGGISTEEFSAELESKLLPGVFACGECLDVCGSCGGYNLQWAWASGMAAGAGVLRKIVR